MTDIPLKDTSLKELMTPHPVTLNIDESFCRVAEIFKEKNIRHLPIVNSSGVIMGIISQRDFHRVTAPKRAPNGEYIYDMNELAKYILRQNIIEKVTTLLPEDTLEKAAGLMAEKKLGCIPIVDAEDRVVGIVTVVDMLKILLRLIRV